MKCEWKANVCGEKEQKCQAVLVSKVENVGQRARVGNERKEEWDPVKNHKQLIFLGHGTRGGKKEWLLSVVVCKQQYKKTRRRKR